MTITPTALLSLPIITTGTESGTWGDVVDNGLTSYLDIAIAGGLSVVITTADVTLANTAGTSAATGIISTTAQYAILNISGAKTAARNLNLPISSREYTINNAGTGGFLLTVRGVTPTTGVTLVDGEKAIVAWNGSDYVKIVSSVATALTGVLAVANGGTGTTTPSIVAGTNVTVSGTWPNQTINSSGGGGGSGTVTSVAASVPAFLSVAGSPITTTGTLAITLSGTALPVANGGTGTTTPSIVAGTNVTVSGTWPNQTINASGSGGSSGAAATVFTTTGTFTIPTGVTEVKVTVVGGGGGGGGGTTGACVTYNGIGGGGGGAAVKWLTGLTPGSTIAVTVGTGGAGGSGGAGATGITSSVASGTQTISTVSATGGVGGSGTGGITALGGTGAAGDLNIGGDAGNVYTGGTSIVGGGGSCGVSGTGTAGRLYGGGGGGSGVSLTGAAGAAGAVFFEY